MTKKRGRTEEAKVNTPIQELEQKETMAHYNAVMLEDLNSKMDLLLEGFKSNSDRLSGVENRLTAVEDAVLGNSNRLTVVENGLRSLKEDMLDMERRICSKINRITDRCERHECRLDALEAG